MDYGKHFEKIQWIIACEISVWVEGRTSVRLQVLHDKVDLHSDLVELKRTVELYLDLLEVNCNSIGAIKSTTQNSSTLPVEFPMIKEVICYAH